MPSIPRKQFYIIRHGETIANAEGWVSGSFDTPLTQKGRTQAQGAKLDVETLPTPPKLIIHSNLSRARDTAQIINQELCLPMQESASIAERCFGDWMGMRLDTMRSLRDAGISPPNGETMSEFTDRIVNGISEILGHPDEPVLLVTHGGVFDAMLRFYSCKIDFVKNCALYDFIPQEPSSLFPWAIWEHTTSATGILSRQQITIIPRT